MRFFCMGVITAVATIGFARAFNEKDLGHTAFYLTILSSLLMLGVA